MCQCLYCMCMCVCVCVCTYIQSLAHIQINVLPTPTSTFWVHGETTVPSLLPSSLEVRHSKVWPGYKLQPTEHKHKWLFLLLVFCCWITNHHKLNSWRQYLFVSSDFNRLSQLAWVPCLESHEPSAARLGSPLQTLGRSLLPFTSLSEFSSSRLWTLEGPCFLAGCHPRASLCS